jgi:hypothetical protein
LNKEKEILHRRVELYRNENDEDGIDFLTRRFESLDIRIDETLELVYESMKLKYVDELDITK